MGGFIVNLIMYTGSDFSHNFFIGNLDSSAVDITTSTYVGYVAKHSGALFANDSTSDITYWNYIPMTCTIIDGDDGILNIQVAKALNNALNEGQYEYFINMRDVNGNTYPKVIFGTMTVVPGGTGIPGVIGPRP